MIYRSWVIVAYIIFIVLIFVRFLWLGHKSTEIRNMEKIWKKYNWVEDTYYEDDVYWFNKKFPVLKSFIKILLFPLLSWFWIGILIYSYFHNKSEEKNLPNNIKEELKEIQFKIRHTDLSKRELICLQNKMVKLVWNDFEKQYIIESWEDRSEYLTVKKDTTHWEYCAYYYPWSHNHNISQYKVEWTKVLEKTIDERTDGYEHWDDWEYHEKTSYYVKDGLATDERLRWDENMKDRREKTEWHELINMKYIPYILYNYDKLSDKDFKNYLRECIKNITECRKEVEEFYKKNEIVYKKNISTKCEEWEELYFIDTYHKFRNNKKDEDKFYNDLEKIIKKFNCEWCDIWSLRKEWKWKIEPRILKLYRKFLKDDIEHY